MSELKIICADTEEKVIITRPQKESSNIWFDQKTDTSFILTDPSECWLKTKLTELHLIQEVLLLCYESKKIQKQINNKKPLTDSKLTQIWKPKVLKSKCKVIKQKLHSYSTDFI